MPISARRAQQVAISTAVAARPGRGGGAQPCASSSERARRWPRSSPRQREAAPSISTHGGAPSAAPRKLSSRTATARVGEELDERGERRREQEAGDQRDARPGAELGDDGIAPQLEGPGDGIGEVAEHDRVDRDRGPGRETTRANATPISSSASKAEPMPRVGERRPVRHARPSVPGRAFRRGRAGGCWRCDDASDDCLSHGANRVARRFQSAPVAGHPSSHGRAYTLAFLGRIRAAARG